jgi:hypothetical protein
MILAIRDDPGARPHPAGLPMKPGMCRSGKSKPVVWRWQALFAALNILDGTVIGRNMQRLSSTHATPVTRMVMNGLCQRTGQCELPGR